MNEVKTIICLFIRLLYLMSNSSFQDILGTQDVEMISRVLSETGEYLITSAPAADPRWGGTDANLHVTLGTEYLSLLLIAGVALMPTFLLL